MTYSEIFIEIVEYAIQNGFTLCGFLKLAPGVNENWKDRVHEWQSVVDITILMSGKTKLLQCNTIIFDQEFLAAFFGAAWHEQVVPLFDAEDRLMYLYNILQAK